MRFPRYKGKSSRKSGLNPIWGNKQIHDSGAPSCEAPSKGAFIGEGVIRRNAEGDSRFFRGFPLHEEMQLVAYDQMKAIPGHFGDIDCEDMSLISNITTAPALHDSLDSQSDNFICGDYYLHGENYDIQFNAIAENISACAGMSLEAATDELFTDFLDSVDGGIQSVVQQLDLTSMPNSATGSLAFVLESSSDLAEDEGFEVHYSPANSEVARITPVQEPSLKRRVDESLQPPLTAEEGVEINLFHPEPYPVKQLIARLAINETALQHERKAWEEEPVMKASRAPYPYTQDIENRPTAKVSNENNGRISFFSPLRSILKSLSRKKLEEKIEKEHHVQKRREIAEIAESLNVSSSTIATDLSTTNFHDIFDSESSEDPLKAEFGAYDDGTTIRAPGP